MVIGIFGVLETGAAYLPIDPEMPEERIKYMLEQVGSETVLTTSDHDIPRVTIKLPDDDIDALCKKAAKAELTVSQLIENFVSDLIDGSRTNGSDERMYAQQWFDRCWFSSPMEETFLSYLIDFDQIDTAIETWEELEYYKKQSELDEYDKEEVELLNEEINELFNDYKELYTNCADETLEEGMKRVTEWFKEREELMNVNKSPTAQEKKR